MKLLVLILDRLPLSFLGCYGNDWIDTPALDRIAAEGVAFDRHYSDCPDAAAARRAWRTGQYAFPLSGEMTPPAAPPDLFRLLERAGIAQERITLNDADALAPAAAGALDRLVVDDSCLLWIEMSTLLPPWNVAEERFNRYSPANEGEGEEIEQVTPLVELPTGPLGGDGDAEFLRLQSTYGALVSSLDEGVERLLDELTRRNLLDEVLLVVTSDRGMALGEHGILGDARPWLHGELVHLPLLVRWPRGAEAGGRIHALTQPVDLMPTLLAAFGVKLVGVHGHNLLPFLNGEPEPVRAFACSGLRRGQALECSLRTLDWSFLLPISGNPDDPPRGPQLYVQPDDRWEMNNVIQHHPELAEELERKLRTFISAPH